MAGLLRRSKLLSGLPRAFQNSAAGCSHGLAPAEASPSLQAAFATLPSKGKKSQLKSAADTTASQEQTSKNRRASAFNFFFKDQVAAAKSDHPNRPVKLGSAMKEFSAKWKALSDQEKQPYIEASNDANKDSPPKGSTSKGTRNLTGYNMFIKENFDDVKARNPTIQPRQIILNMSREWKSLASAEKQKYKDKADKSNLAKA